MTSEKAGAWFESIKDTPLRDRIFVLMLFMNFLLGGALIYVSTYLSDEKNKENSLRIAAETEVRILQSNNLKDSKDWIQAVSQAEKACNEKWELKFEREREINGRFMQEKADKLEQQLRYLQGESAKMRKEAKTIKTQVGL